MIIIIIIIINDNRNSNNNINNDNLFQYEELDSDDDTASQKTPAKVPLCRHIILYHVILYGICIIKPIQFVLNGSGAAGITCLKLLRAKGYYFINIAEEQ